MSIYTSIWSTCDLFINNLHSNKALLVKDYCDHDFKNIVALEEDLKKANAAEHRVLPPAVKKFHFPAFYRIARLGQSCRQPGTRIAFDYALHLNDFEYNIKHEWQSYNTWKIWTIKMASYDLTAFGERLKQLRKKLYLSQSELAEKLEVSRSFISELESGQVRCGCDFIFKLSEIFNVNLYYLVRGEGTMFDTQTPRTSLSGKAIGDPIESISELLWYLEHSSLMRYNIMFAASRILLDEEDRIAKEIEKFNAAKNKKEESKEEKIS